MKPPLFVRDLTDAERTTLRGGLRSPEAFTLRRSQILLASAGGQPPARIATTLGCATQTVRDAIRAFHAAGVGCLLPKSKAPKTTHPVWPRDRDDDIKGLLHQSPRTLGQPTSLWTLDLVASVCHEKGWTARVLSPETIRQVLRRLNVAWKRAKHWITSPDPEYAKKKSCGTG
jgi:Winged helix-turn helix